MRTDLRHASDVTLAMAVARWDEEALAEVTAEMQARFTGWPGGYWGTALTLKRPSRRCSSGSGKTQPASTRTEGRCAPSCSLRFIPAPSTCSALTLPGGAGKNYRLAAAVPGPNDVEQEFSDLATAEVVREALGSLQPAERSAIELAYFEGHTYREVATILGQPEGTVKSRIRSGMRRMQNALAAKGLVIGNVQTAEEAP